MIALLAEFRRLPGHVFWSDNVSPADPHALAFTRTVGHRQITDAHLVTVAIQNDGRLATFDAGISGLLPEEARGIIELIP